jgi:hypothetical protein
MESLLSIGASIVSIIAASIGIWSARQARSYRDQIVKFGNVSAAVIASGNGGDGIHIGKDNRDIYFGTNKVM